MPEFILEHGTREASERFAKLDEFTQAYVEAMFWTETSDRADECHGATFADLDQTALASIVETCREFQESFADLLESVYNTSAWSDRRGEYSATNAGHDFWLTRNGHGAGFWDRGLGDIGDKLTQMSKPYGESLPYRGDDGKVYIF